MVYIPSQDTDVKLTNLRLDDPDTWAPILSKFIWRTGSNLLYVAVYSIILETLGCSGLIVLT